MSHDIFKPSNLIGCLENKTADSTQTRKRAIVTRPFPSPGGRGLGTRLRPSPLLTVRITPLTTLTLAGRPGNEASPGEPRSLL